MSRERGSLAEPSGVVNGSSGGLPAGFVHQLGSRSVRREGVCEWLEQRRSPRRAKRHGRADRALTPSYPPEIAIRHRGPLDAVVTVPGSKSITNRAAPIAALANGTSTLRGCLESDDTEAMREALRALGVAIDVRGDTWTVRGRNGVLHAPQAKLDARASGTTARFLFAAATARRHGIKRMIFGMVGLPFESAADVRSTLDLCRAIDAELTIISAQARHESRGLHCNRDYPQALPDSQVRDTILSPGRIHPSG